MSASFLGSETETEASQTEFAIHVCGLRKSRRFQPSYLVPSDQLSAHCSFTRPLNFHRCRPSIVPCTMVGFEARLKIQSRVEKLPFIGESAKERGERKKGRKIASPKHRFGTHS